MGFIQPVTNENEIEELRGELYTLDVEMDMLLKKREKVERKLCRAKKVQAEKDQGHLFE